MHAVVLMICLRWRGNISARACCRDLSEQDVLRAMRRVSKHKEGELNNRPLIGVLSQVSSIHKSS